jgi:hypothetical protein
MMRSRIGVLPHRPEFQHREEPTVPTELLLPIQNRHYRVNQGRDGEAQQ